MKIAIFASGRGSNAEAVLEAVKNGTLKNVEVAALVSDNPDARALKVAEKYGVNAVFIDPKHKGARFSEEGERDYADFIEKLAPDLIFLLGFMRILPQKFLEGFKGKILNLHPSLLPAYKGLTPIKRAFEAGEKRTGCTVHYVTAELDGGETLAQKTVEILPSDTLETLEEKIHAEEHKLVVEVLAQI